MKHTTLHRGAALVLSLLLTMSLAACGGEQESAPTDDASQGSSGKLETVVTDAPPEHTPDEPFAYSEAAQAAIDGLYTNYWHEFFAAAYLGYREEGDTTDLAPWLHDEAPALASIWPFLTEIPEEDIIGDHGYLYCIVPLDSTLLPITVKSVEWEYEGNGATPHYSDPLYNCEIDKPFLLYTTCETWLEEFDVVIEFEEAGLTKIWHPSMEPDEGVISNREIQRGGNMILDFTHLYEVGDYVPHLDGGLDPSLEWLPPSPLDLADTTWYSDNGWLLEFSPYNETGSGDLVLYQPVTGGEFPSLSPYYDSTWWMEDDSLCLGIYNGVCPFPLLLSPAGDQLVIMKADDGSVLPFFEPGQGIVGLSMSFG